MFSIIIPTWNNLAFIQLCVDSIRRHSAYNHQIIIHVNEGSDGTLQWVKEKKISHSFSKENSGICLALNEAAMLASNDLLVYMNDDMYCLPGWDTALLKAIEGCTTDLFMFSATMIEPNDTGNKAVIVANYGTDISNFKEQELLNKYTTYEMNDWQGSSWPPNVVHKKYWHIVGGYSIEFSPGMSSDDDFAIKMWKIGCRHFKGIAESRVYHFQTKSTERIKKNRGSHQFLMKWGIPQSLFNRKYLHKGEKFDPTIRQITPPPLTFYERFKIFYKKIRN